MIRNYFLLNLVLIIVIAVLGNKLYHVVKYRMEMPAETAAGEVPKEVTVPGHADKIFDENAVESISAMDLFRPSRSAPSVENKTTDKPPLPSPPKLFGTVILNDMKTAILEPSDTRTTKVYRINDTVSGYTILEIYEDKVVLMGNDERVEVRLRDDKGVTAPSRPVIRPPMVPQAYQPARQAENPATVRQRRVRPVPPRRRPSRIVPPENRNVNPPEMQQPQQQEPEEQEPENDGTQEEDQ